jgi:hypothetical protein
VGDEAVELTIDIGAAAGSSGLERDGLLRRLEEAVMGVEEFLPGGYITSGFATAESVRLIIGAPGLASPAVLSVVGDSVAALLRDPDLQGWGPFSVGVTGEAFDTEEAAEVEGFGDESPVLLDPSGQDDAVGSPDDHVGYEVERRRLVRDALHLLEGLESGWLTGLDMEAGSPDERARAWVESEYVAGALFGACVVVIDHLFMDLNTLMQRGNEATVASTGEEAFFVLDGLPPRYAHRYGDLFVQQLIVATVDVTRRFTAGWEPLACVAQELALRMILDQAQVQLELAAVDVSEDWRGVVEDALFEDSDHEMLFDPALDGIEDDTDSMNRVRAAPMAFADWFKPFNSERHLPPYVVDQPDRDAGEEQEPVA